jgi:tetratricopeptide (TPR) repeat protein
MSTYDNVNHLFDELKKCPPADVSKHFQALVESFLLLGKPEQKEFADSFHTWAVQYAGGKPVLFCYAKLILAFSFFYSEQYDKALPMLIEAQNLFTEYNEPDGVALCTILQGSIFRTFGNVDLALKLSWSSLDQLSKSGHFPFFLIACNVNIGGIYYDRKHYDEASPHFKDALALAEKTEKYYWIIYSLHGLGKTYLMQNKFPEAKECLEKAMSVAEKYNNPSSIATSLTELGGYHYATGGYAEAEQYHKRSLEIREQNQFIGGAITNCICLAEINIKQFRPDEAIVFLEKGLKMADEIKVKPKMYQVHRLLSEIYQGKNDLVKSLFHYKLFHELREQVEFEGNERKINNARLIFEAEQTLKENIIIKKQKAEIERKNIELQETIDELTLARIGKKARAITLIVAIVLFILEDFILSFALEIVPANSYILSLIVKMVIIFSLSPINKAVEKYLLKRVVKKKKREVLV